MLAEMVAMADEELDHRRLVALRRAVAAQPALLHVRRGHDRAALPTKRPVENPLYVCGAQAGGCGRPSIQISSTPFRRLSPHVDGDQPLVVRIALFPDSEVADGAHLVRSDVSVALMVTECQARWVV